jgi:hypothetical protein
MDTLTLMYGIGLLATKAVGTAYLDEELTIALFDTGHSRARLHVVLGLGFCTG